MWWPSFVAVLQDLSGFCFSAARPMITVSPTNQLTAVPRTPSLVVRIPTPGQLVSGERYDVNHAHTTEIRTALARYDEHLVQKSTLTLREWLLCVVHYKRQSVPLLALQMTPIGSWHRTLKGLSGISVGITPYTGALMEWGSDPQTGNTALVLEVSPEEIITIGELGAAEPGIYTKRGLPKQTWLELRPVFTTLQ
jgi:hypothetical protein